MEELKASKSLTNSGDAALVLLFLIRNGNHRPGRKLMTVRIRRLPKTSTKRFESNFRELPFKFDKIEESNESSFCLPCTTPPNPNQERPQQRSLTQAGDAEYIPDFSRTIDTTAVTCMPAQSFQPANCSRSVPVGSTNGGMYPMMQPEMNCMQFACYQPAHVFWGNECESHSKEYIQSCRNRYGRVVDG
jgi:hypothetical protein